MDELTRLIAIDPGDKHVGICYDHANGVGTAELTPAQALDWLNTTLGVLAAAGPVEVVVESYKLYPGQDSRTVYKRLKTPELIGAIKLTCLRWGVPVVEQDATIKKPMRAQLRARKIKQVGVGTHQRDAELHYYRRKLGPRGSI